MLTTLLITAGLALGQAPDKSPTSDEARAKVVALVRQLDNDELRSRVMYEFGHTYRLLNKPDEALRNYQDSLAIRKRLGQKAGIARALAEIAEIQYSQGKPDAAIASYKEAMQLQREIGDKTYLSHTLLNLGGIYMDHAQYADALTKLKESLQMQRELHTVRRTNTQGRPANVDSPCTLW